MQPRILVADDQADILSALKLLLKREGFEVATASSPAGVQDIVAREHVDVALVDLNYTRDTTSGEEGIALVEQLHREHPDLAVLDCDAGEGLLVPIAASLRAASVRSLLLVGEQTELPAGVGGAGDEIALKPLPADALVYRLQALLIRAGRALPTESGAWADSEAMGTSQMAGEGHVVSVFAPKGGVGKTTVSVNLGALAA